MLDALLPEMENRRGKLVTVFAGYKKQMEELLAHNEGLPSRFPMVCICVFMRWGWGGEDERGCWRTTRACSRFPMAMSVWGIT